MVLEIIGPKIVFILGIINVISILFVFLSRRCLIGTKFINNMWQKHNWYKKFYSKHCYFWRIFMVSVLLHAVLAFIIFGWPF